jgi:hypothetical protein
MSTDLSDINYLRNFVIYFYAFIVVKYLNLADLFIASSRYALG